MEPCGVATSPAIALRVASGIDAQPIAAATTIVYQRHGDDSLSVVRASTTAPIRIGSRPGSYDLRVITPEFADWVMTDVAVDAEGGEPRTRPLTAFLQPQR